MTKLSETHQRCLEIFRKSFYEIPDGETYGDFKYYGSSRACRIYEKLTSGDVSRQDCIGENFNQLLHRVNDNWFENYKPTSDLDYYFINYFLLLYLFVERVDLIFEVLNKDGKSKLFTDFHFQNFKTLRIINKWANFIKHPKEFLFTHWPKYYIADDETISITDEDVKIDTNFVFAHYQHDKQPSPVILENNQKVFVEIPNLENLTSEFCREMNVFFDFICNNEIVSDFLKKKSTIKNHYYDDEDDEINQEEEAFQL